MYAKLVREAIKQIYRCMRYWIYFNSIFIIQMKNNFIDICTLIKNQRI